MGPIEAFTTAWRKSFTYGGKATRSEYWWFVLLDAIVYFILLIIGTTTMPDVLESMDMTSAFDVSLHVPTLKKDDTRNVLNKLDVFAANDVDKALQLIDDDMPIKRLLTLLEMAKQDRSGAGAVEGHIPMEQFAECMADIGA